ncbi:type II secretion system F family protein [Catenulispora subtropica]|uniref:Type II secretion system F family protein n=2 Tax=Catenulispora subtropica TaxID=450798 RepID=A0ABN2T8R9_9ACTN
MLLAGAGFGLGLTLLARGLFPPKPTLAQALADLNRAPAPVRILSADDGGWAARFGGPLVGLLQSWNLPGEKVARDLQVLERSARRHLAEKAVAALAGLLLPLVLTAVLAVAGVVLPWSVPAWGALACAAAGFFVPDLTVKSEATARRMEFRHAFTAFIDLVVIGLSGGAGVEAALDQAARIGEGWSFTAIRKALDAARLSRVAPWTTLGQLGVELDVPVLEEIAASLTLAGVEGAKIRTSLSAKAAALRAHALSDADADAQQATERMALPVVQMFAGFLVFIAYPALAHALGAL